MKVFSSDPKLPPPDPDPVEPGPAPVPIREPERPDPDVIDPRRSRFQLDCGRNCVRPSRAKLRSFFQRRRRIKALCEFCRYNAENASPYP